MTLPTPADYAAHLVEQVRLALTEEPARFAAARTWADLHDVCDANDFLQEADEHFGLPCNPADEDWCEMANAAMGIAEATLWPACTCGNYYRALPGGLRVIATNPTCPVHRPAVAER